MQYLKQSTAVTVLIGPFLDATNAVTAETGLTVAQADVRLSKNAGNIAQKGDATACTHDELGYYTCPLSTTDTGTLGHLKLAVHASGALPVWHDYEVVTANVWDSLFSTDKLQVDAVEIGGDATAADNLELEFDGTGYAGGTTKRSVNVVAVAANALTASALAADAAAEIADAVWDEATSGHTAVGSTGKALTDAGAAGTPPTVGEIADAVLDEALSGHATAGTTGAALTAAAAIDPPTTAEIVTAMQATSTYLHQLWRRLCNKCVTDDSAGTITTYADNDSTPLFTLTAATIDDVTTITRS